MNNLYIFVASAKVVYFQLESDPFLNYYLQGNMKEYKLFKKEPKTSKYYVYSKTKKRYIDPLVQTIDGVKRVSQIDSDFKKIIQNHIGASDKWIVVDYERNDM